MKKIYSVLIVSLFIISLFAMTAHAKAEATASEGNNADAVATEVAGAAGSSGNDNQNAVGTGQAKNEVLDTTTNAGNGQQTQEQQMEQQLTSAQQAILQLDDNSAKVSNDKAAAVLATVAEKLQAKLTGEETKDATDTATLDRIKKTEQATTALNEALLTSSDKAKIEVVGEVVNIDDGNFFVSKKTSIDLSTGKSTCKKKLLGFIPLSC